MKMEIESKKELIERMREMRDKITLDYEKISVKITGYNDNKGSLTAKILDMERELQNEIAELLEICEDIRDCIETVEDSRLKAILIYKYIHLYTNDKIAQTLNESLRNTAYLVNKALEEVVIPNF